MSTLYYESSFAHHGVKGQKWGVRRYQNPDGSLTKAGRNRSKSDSFNKKVSDISHRDYRYDATNDTASKTIPYALSMYKKGFSEKKITSKNSKKLKTLLDDTIDKLHKIGSIEDDLNRDDLGKWISDENRWGENHNRHYMEMSRQAKIVSMMDDGNYPTSGNLKTDLVEAKRAAKEYVRTNFDAKNFKMHAAYDSLKKKYHSDSPIDLVESLVKSVSDNDNAIYKELNRLNINYESNTQSQYNRRDRKR